MSVRREKERFYRKLADLVERADLFLPMLYGALVKKLGSDGFQDLLGDAGKVLGAFFPKKEKDNENG